MGGDGWLEEEECGSMEKEKECGEREGGDKVERGTRNLNCYLDPMVTDRKMKSQSIDEETEFKKNPRMVPPLNIFSS